MDEAELREIQELLSTEVRRLGWGWIVDQVTEATKTVRPRFKETIGFRSVFFEEEEEEEEGRRGRESGRKREVTSVPHDAASELLALVDAMERAVRELPEIAEATSSAMRELDTSPVSWRSVSERQLHYLPSSARIVEESQSRAQLLNLLADLRHRVTQ
jgi:hypothetical protein